MYIAASSNKKKLFALFWQNLWWTSLQTIPH